MFGLTSTHVWSAIGVAAAPYLIAVILCVVTFLGMRFLVKKKEQAIYVEFAVKILKALFGDKLGGKLDEFFDVWIECLDKVRSGEWTTEEMIDEFCKIIVSSKDIQISEEEIQKVKDVTNQSLKILNLNENKNQMSLMSVVKK